MLISSFQRNNSILETNWVLVCDSFVKKVRENFNLYSNVQTTLGTRIDPIK